MNIKVLFDVVTKQPWVVRLVRSGELYGLDDQVQHLQDEPLVEFYDGRYPHTDLGQFVSRYYSGTLLSSAADGLCLQGGVPSWNLSASLMDDVRAWLRAQGCTPNALLMAG